MSSRPDATDPLDRIETLWAQEYGPEELDAEIVRDVLALVAVARAAQVGVRWLEDALSRNQIVHESDRSQARAFLSIAKDALARLDRSAEGGAR